MDQVFPKTQSIPVQSLIMDHASGRHHTHTLSSEQNEELGTENAEPVESQACVTIQSPDPREGSYVLRDFDKLVFNIVGFLTDKSEVPPLCGLLKEHKNVALNRSRAKLKYGDGHYNCISLYKGSLDGEISDGEFSKCSEDFYITLLLQVTHGILHLHEQETFLGNMDASHIYFSSDRRNAVIKTDHHPDNLNGENACVEHNQSSDIFQLGKLFYTVLTKGLHLNDLYKFDVHKLQCSDKKIAGDLILKMLHKEIDCEEILKHPFFWSASKKITYVCDAFDYCKDDEEGRRCIDIGKPFPEGGWLEKLRLTKEEKKEIEEHARRTNSKKSQISLETLYNLASGRVGRKKSKKMDVTTRFFDESVGHLKPINSIPAKKWEALVQKPQAIPSNHTAVHEAAKTLGAEYALLGQIVLVKDISVEDKYDKNSFFELLRFFRNRKAHYWESKNVRRCFQSYPHGFWRFFSSRYPDILCYIYNNKEKFPFLENHTCDIERNKSLPDIRTAN